MDFAQIVAVAASQGGGAAPAPVELYPDPALDSANYALGDAGVTHPAGSFLWDFGTLADTVRATSALADSIIAALANSTAYQVRFTISDWDAAGGASLRVSLKGGSLVDMAIIGNGVFTKTVTTGASAVQADAILIRPAVGGSGPKLRLTDISVV